MTNALIHSTLIHLGANENDTLAIVVSNLNAAIAQLQGTPVAHLRDIHTKLCKLRSEVLFSGLSKESLVQELAA